MEHQVHIVSPLHTKSDTSDSNDGHDWSWFWRGCRNIFSIPAIVLLSAFIGYGGITRDAGLSLSQAAFSVAAIWALPSNLIMVAGVASGASLITIFVAVALASLRMMPMTIALIPEVRAPATKKWQLLIASTVVAVTAWVHTMQFASSIPVRGRLPYFMGFGFILMVGSTLMTTATYLVAATLSPILLAALYFLTPIYFVISIWKTSREWAEYASLLLGLALYPLFMLVAPDAAILMAGFVGGSVAFAVRHIRKKMGGSI